MVMYRALVIRQAKYHFGDYRRLGLPLSLMIIGIGVPPAALV